MKYEMKSFCGNLAASTMNRALKSSAFAASAIALALTCAAPQPARAAGKILPVSAASPDDIAAGLRSPWENLQVALAAGEVVVLTNDVVCDDQSLGPLVVPAGVTASLDLNGHTVDRALAAPVPNGRVFVVETNGKLTISDTAGGGVVTGGNTIGDVAVDDGGLVLDGSSDIPCGRGGRGGGAFVAAGGSLAIIGGTFATNSAAGNGGAIYSQGALRVTGSAFVGNDAESHAGAVYTSGSNVIVRLNAFVGNQAGYDDAIYCEESPAQAPGDFDPSSDSTAALNYNWFGFFGNYMKSPIPIRGEYILDRWCFLKIWREIDVATGNCRLTAMPCVFNSVRPEILEIANPADCRLPPIPLCCIATNATFDGATVTSSATIRLSKDGYTTAAFVPQTDEENGYSYTVGVVVPWDETIAETLTFERSIAVGDGGPLGYSIPADYAVTAFDGTNALPAAIFAGKTVSVALDGVAGSFYSTVSSNGTFRLDLGDAVSNGTYAATFSISGYKPAKATLVVAGNFQFEGAGTVYNPYLIPSAQAWDALSVRILQGGCTYGAVYKQTGSFTVSTMLGKRQNPFEGVYIGGGNVLTVSIESDKECAAPFSWISNATICDLVVTGRVTGADYAAGLVGCDSSSSTIENCDVSVDVQSAYGGEHAGGIVGRCAPRGSSGYDAGHRYPYYDYYCYWSSVAGCVFRGSISGATCAGTICGWNDDNAVPYIESCLDLSGSEFPIGEGGCMPCVYGGYYTNTNKSESSSSAWKGRGMLAYSITGGDGVSIKYDDEVKAQFDVSGIKAHKTGVLRGDVFYTNGRTVLNDVENDKWQQINHLVVLAAARNLEYPHLSACDTNGDVYVEVNGGTVNFYNDKYERNAENLVATGTLSGTTVAFHPVHYEGPLVSGQRTLEGVFQVPNGALINDVDIVIHLDGKPMPIAFTPSYLGPTNEYRELIGFTATEGMLTRNGESGYLLAMANEDVTINANVIDRIDLAYVNAQGEPQTILRPSQYRLVFPETEELNDGWWAVTDKITLGQRLNIAGHVNLVLADGAELRAAGGIHLRQGDDVSLTIWGQSGCTGALVVDDPGDGNAGIGGNVGENGGRLVVNGGVLDISGGGRNGPGGSIDGGTVAAFALPGQFKVSGTDSSQLTNMSSSSIGYALKHRWYYGINAYDDGAGGLQYAVTIYSDSDRTNAVATSEKMLGSGSREMRRSIRITDTYTMGDVTYGYRTTYDEETSEYTLNIIDEAGTVVAKATGVVGANCNITATNGGANVGTVTFGLIDMTAGDTGTVYMANMRSGLPAGGTTISMTTTIQGNTYAGNCGIDVSGDNPVFDISVDLGDDLTATDSSPSYGVFYTINSGAGIGGGYKGAGGTVTINGGSVTVISGSAGSQAIGHGEDAADSGRIFFGDTRVGYVEENGEVHDWASSGAREDWCRSTNRLVRIEDCFPHKFDGASCTRCGAHKPPVVSNVVARQRWPWNGLVDVDYEIGGYTAGLKVEIDFDEQGGRHWSATNFLAGAEPAATIGHHRATWDAKADGVTNVITEVAATVKLVKE